MKEKKTRIDGCEECGDIGSYNIDDVTFNDEV